MPCEKSRKVNNRSPPARILEILSFSKFNREDNFFADNHVHILGRYNKRNRGNGRILHAIRRTGTTGKAQPLERNAAAYLIKLFARKRNRFCKPCRRSSLPNCIQQEDEKRIHKAISALSDKQKDLAEKVFFKGMTLTAIAKEKGVSQPAITQQLATVLKN